MQTKYDQTISPVMDPSLQLLTSDLGVFSVKVHSTNPEQFYINENVCVRQLNEIFKDLVRQESEVWSQVRNLKQIMTVIGQDKRSILDLVLGPSTTQIRQKGTIEKPPCTTFILAKKLDIV